MTTTMTTKEKRPKTSKPRPTKRSTKQPALSLPTDASEQLAEVLAVIREEDAAENVGIESETPAVDERPSEAAPVVVSTVAAGVAAEIGKEAARYLRRHARKPYDKPEDIEWMIARARAAWHAALSSDVA
jgi:hypothetical protein